MKIELLELAAGGLSALLALAAVVLPQHVALFAARKNAAGFRRFGGLFKFWGLKFSLTLLFLVVLIKSLAAAGWLSVPALVGGTVAGLVLNILLAARLAKAKE